MRVGVFLELSSPSANLLKARVSEGWSSDITTEVPRTSSMAIAGLPSVPTEASPARAEVLVWRGGMTIQEFSLNIPLRVRMSRKSG